MSGRSRGNSSTTQTQQGNGPQQKGQQTGGGRMGMGTGLGSLPNDMTGMMSEGADFTSDVDYAAGGPPVISSSWAGGQGVAPQQYHHQQHQHQHQQQYNSSTPPPAPSMGMPSRGGRHHHQNQHHGTTAQQNPHNQQHQQQQQQRTPPSAYQQPHPNNSGGFQASAGGMMGHPGQTTPPQLPQPAYPGQASAGHQHQNHHHHHSHQHNAGTGASGAGPNQGHHPHGHHGVHHSRRHSSPTDHIPLPPLYEVATTSEVLADYAENMFDFAFYGNIVSLAESIVPRVPTTITRYSKTRHPEASFTLKDMWQSLRCPFGTTVPLHGVRLNPGKPVDRAVYYTPTLSSVFFTFAGHVSQQKRGELLGPSSSTGGFARFPGGPSSTMGKGTPQTSPWRNRAPGTPTPSTPIPEANLAGATGEPTLPILTVPADDGRGDIHERKTSYSSGVGAAHPAPHSMPSLSNPPTMKGSEGGAATIGGVGASTSNTTSFETAERTSSLELQSVVGMSASGSGVGGISRSLNTPPLAAAPSTTVGSTTWNGWPNGIYYSEELKPEVRLPLYDQVERLSRECPGFFTAKNTDFTYGSWFAVLWQPIYCQNHTTQRSAGSFLAFYLIHPPPLPGRSVAYDRLVFRCDRLLFDPPLWLSTDDQLAELSGPIVSSQDLDVEEDTGGVTTNISEGTTTTTTTTSGTGEGCEAANSATSSTARSYGQGYAHAPGAMSALPTSDAAYIGSGGSIGLDSGDSGEGGTPGYVPLFGLIPQRARPDIWYPRIPGLGLSGHGTSSSHHQNPQLSANLPRFMAPLFLSATAVQLMSSLGHAFPGFQMSTAPGSSGLERGGNISSNNGTSGGGQGMVSGAERNMGNPAFSTGAGTDNFRVEDYYYITRHDRILLELM